MLNLRQANNEFLSREAQELKCRLAEQSYDQVLNWIHNPELDSRHVDQPLKSTNDWFMESEAFQSWVHEDQSLLWCYGSQGTGKTVLSRTVYECMCMQGKQGDENIALSMISCSFDSGHTPDHLTANMLRQIARQPMTWRKRYVLSNKIKELHQKYGKDGAQKSPSGAQIREVLPDELKRFRTIYVILDGLDELSTRAHRTELLDTLYKLKSVEYSLMIMVFSKKLPEIQEWFSKYNCIGSQSVELVPSEEHLLAYIKSRIYASGHLKRMIGQRSQLVDEILRRVYSNASNTYVWCASDTITRLLK